MYWGELRVNQIYRLQLISIYYHFLKKNLIKSKKIN